MLDENDHRSLGQRLDLFHFREEAPGMVFWHAKGFLLYRLLEHAVRSHFSAAGYAEVRTPQLLRRSVWEASGHWAHFYDGMFRVADQDVDVALKPVSCPGHVFIAARRHPSYRELPLKLAEFGLVHRDEASGTLHGLLRLRQFTQDDGHVFARPDQAPAAIAEFCRSVPPFYARFGFEHISVTLATRPAERVGSDSDWDHAEQVLQGVLDELGWKYAVAPGGGAFYGPKLEFVLRDRLGRDWQCGTIQYDFSMPERFGLQYVDRDGARKNVVMLHRALYGSLERFLGVLLEQHGAHLPAWLSPEQVRVLPVAPEHAEAAASVCGRFGDARLRASLDDRNESLARRIAEAHDAAVPFVAVIGQREVESGGVSLRARDGKQSLPVAAAVERLSAHCANPFGTMS